MQGPVIRGTGYEREEVYRRGEFLRFVPFLTHVQLHNSIVISIRTLLSPGFLLHLFDEGQYDGSEKFALTSFLKLDFDGERRGNVDFDVKRAPWNKPCNTDAHPVRFYKIYYTYLYIQAENRSIS